MMAQEMANHLWQSTLFAIAIGIISLLFRNNGAHVRYWLWWIASVKFLLPFSVLTWLGTTLAIGEPARIVPESVTATLTVVARPFAADPRFLSAENVILAVWVSGALLLLGRWLVEKVRLRRTLRNAVKDPSPWTDGWLKLDVYRSNDDMEPGVVGSFRPALVLPAGIEHRLSSSQLNALFAHEVAHVYRRDNLTAAVHTLVEAVFWFHPLVWWIGARLIDERERACDEAVVASGHDRKAYAASILDVCEHYVAAPSRCAAGISGSDLKHRITRIMRYQNRNQMILAKKLLLAVAAAVILAAPFLAGIGIPDQALAQIGQPEAERLRDEERQRMEEEERLRAERQAEQEEARRQAEALARELSESLGTEQDTGMFLPVVKAAPVYPPRAAARGMEGYVVVQYTVTARGDVENIRVIESSSPLFERSAVESVALYKYEPRGFPTHIRNRINFELND